MRIALRLFVSAGAVVLAGYLLELMRPGWTDRFGTDVSSVQEIRADLRKELELGRRLDQEGAALWACLLSKRQLLTDLIEARLDLLETAMRYRELDRSLGNGQCERLRSAWRGDSEIECYCRQVIQAAQWQLAEQPCAAAAVAARLQAEFDAAEAMGIFSSAE